MEETKIDTDIYTVLDKNFKQKGFESTEQMINIILKSYIIKNKLAGVVSKRKLVEDFSHFLSSTWDDGKTWGRKNS